jgi:hypothetical protein
MLKPERALDMDQALLALLVALGLRSLSETAPAPPPPPPPTELRSPAAQVQVDAGEQNSAATSLLDEQ